MAELLTPEFVELVQQTLMGMMLAAVYSVVFYSKKRANETNFEDFNTSKFMATVVVGAIVGAGFAMLGLEVSADTIELTLASYVGVIAIVESLLKVVWRTFNVDSTVSSVR